jgi:large subunit ribosomal protein L25
MQYHLHNEAFYTQIITLNVGGSKEEVLLKDLQHNPARMDIMHVDFARVDAAKAVHTHVPLHFINEDVSPGLKLEGGVISHVVTDVEVVCLAKDIPEFIEVDLADMHVGDILHLSNLKMPANVEVLALKQGEEHDSAVASMHTRKGGAESTDEEATDESEAGGEPEA